MVGSLVLTGCGKDSAKESASTESSVVSKTNEVEKTDTPEKAAMDYYNFFVKIEGSALKERGVSENELESTLGEIKEALQQQIISAFETNNVAYNEKEVEEVVNFCFYILKTC